MIMYTDPALTAGDMIRIKWKYIWTQDKVNVIIGPMADLWTNHINHSPLE